MLYVDCCAHFAVYFLAFLFPVLLVCFLHRLFKSGSLPFLSESAHLLSEFSMLIFPNSSFPYPRASLKFWISLHISLHFVSFFISLFISIGSVLFVYLYEFWFVSLSLSPLSFLP
jgi:hypothetical protein